MICISEFSAALLFSRLERQFDAVAAARGLDLRLVPSTALLHTDPILLAQILDHLVANAIAHGDGGRILVGCRRHGDRLRIEVWDGGTGLGEAWCRTLLGPASEAPTALGQGIGLAVVGRLVRLMRLPIKVTAASNRGTGIAILAPLAEGTPGLVRRRMVVVIDDEEQVLEGLRLLLEAWQFDVVAACTGEQALGHLRRLDRRPCGIIADHQLRAGCTGSEAVGRICAFYRSAIPSIIITGDAVSGSLAEARGQGAVILQKPVGAAQLHSILLQTLELSGV